MTPPSPSSSLPPHPTLIAAALRWIACPDPWPVSWPAKVHPGAQAFYDAERYGYAAHDPVWRLTEKGANALGLRSHRFNEGT